MIRFLFLILLLVSWSSQAQADAFKDCAQGKDLDRRINGCSRYIDANVSSRVLQVWENVTAAIGVRGHAYRKKGQHGLAIKDFTRVIKRRREVDPVTRLNRAISYEATGERDKAILDYKVIVQFLKNNPFYESEYGAHAAHARKALTRLGVDFPKPAASPKAKKSSKSSSSGNANSDHTSGPTQSGDGLFDRAKKNKAVDPCAGSNNRGCKAAEQLNKKSIWRFAKRESSKSKSTKTTKLALKQSADAYNRGLLHRKKREYDKAISEHTKAITLNPENADAYLDRARAYFAKGQYNQAIADNSRVLKLRPKETKALNNRGNAYHSKSQNDLAIADYTAAMKINPKDGTFYYNRGKAHRDKKLYDRAITDFNEALRLEPTFKYAVPVNKGQTYYANGQYDLAITEYDKAIKANPKYFGAYRNRGYAYSRLGEYENANADYSKARELNAKVVINPPAKDMARPAKPEGGKTVSNEMDLAFWNDVKNSNDAEMLQAYLDEFPNGTFARLARLKLQKLKKTE